MRDIDNNEIRFFYNTPDKLTVLTLQYADSTNSVDKVEILRTVAALSAAMVSICRRMAETRHDLPVEDFWVDRIGDVEKDA